MNDFERIAWELECLRAELRGTSVSLAITARENVTQGAKVVSDLWVDNTSTYERHESSRLRSIAKRAFGRLFR